MCTLKKGYNNTNGLGVLKGDMEIFHLSTVHFTSFPGEAGSGKSSAVAKLSLDWTQSKDEPKTGFREKLMLFFKKMFAKGTVSERYPTRNTKRLKKFDFTFLIKLKNVDKNVPLEREVIEQHDLEADENQIEWILRHCKILLILDGYDEYKKGTNSDIDAAISGKRGNSYVFITSRPDYMHKKDKNKLDAKIQLRGLSQENIRRYIERHLEDRETAESLMEAAERSRIFDLLRIPIIALMLCILYKERKQLPRTQTEIIWEIIQIYIKRAKEKGVELPNEEEMLYVLGELSWEALRRNTHQLLIRKVIHTQ